MVNVGELVLYLEENGIKWDFESVFSIGKNFRNNILSIFISYIYIS